LVQATLVGELIADVGCITLSTTLSLVASLSIIPIPI
jgi:hypothetical protein